MAEDFYVRLLLKNAGMYHLLDQAERGEIFFRALCRICTDSSRCFPCDKDTFDPDKLTPTGKVVYKSFVDQIDSTEAHAIEVSKKRSEAGRKGGIESGKTRSKTKQNEANEAILNININKKENKNQHHSTGEALTESESNAADSDCGCCCGGGDDNSEGKRSRFDIYQLAVDIGLDDPIGQIDRLCNQYTEDWIKEALTVAVDYNPQQRSWGLVTGVLRNWKQRGGIDTACKSESRFVGQKKSEPPIDFGHPTPWEKWG